VRAACDRVSLANGHSAPLRNITGIIRRMCGDFRSGGGRQDGSPQRTQAAQ
jgi:hypothetical protein